MNIIDHSTLKSNESYASSNFIDKIICIQRHIKRYLLKKREQAHSIETNTLDVQSAHNISNHDFKCSTSGSLKEALLNVSKIDKSHETNDSINISSHFISSLNKIREVKDNIIKKYNQDSISNPNYKLYKYDREGSVGRSENKIQINSLKEEKQKVLCKPNDTDRSIVIPNSGEKSLFQNTENEYSPFDSIISDENDLVASHAVQRGEEIKSKAQDYPYPVMSKTEHPQKLLPKIISYDKSDSVLNYSLSDEVMFIKVLLKVL